MDRLGVTFNRTPEGFRDQRRFGGTLFQRTAFAGATTGQQLLYALDEQVRRWEVAGKVKKYEFWDFLGPMLDDNGRCRGCVGQDLVTMEIRAFPADAVVVARGGCGLIFGRSTNSMACNGSAASRVFQAGGQVRQRRVHPGPPHGHPRRRQAAADQRERPRRRGPRVGAAASRRIRARRSDIPENERYYFLEERYPKYGNLVPRDIATREIFKVCTHEGLSVEAGPDVRLSRRDPHSRASCWTASWPASWKSTRSSRASIPATVPMKIFPAVHYSMGGLWVDYEANGRRRAGTSARRATSRPTFPACTPSASATTSTTAPTAWAPIRWWPASSAA